MRDLFLSVTSLADLVLWRDGGQRQARRNAWAAMVVDNARARARQEADAAVRSAARRSDLSAAQ
jgi:hypothetical protein